MKYTLYEIAKQTARKLRKSMTPAEKILWEYLRKKSIDGYRFLRQHPLFVLNMGKNKFFIADFYCHQVRLVIELDGPIHQFQKEYDLERAELLEAHGYIVLRFRNEEITEQLQNVLQKIETTLHELSASAKSNT